MSKVWLGKNVDAAGGNADRRNRVVAAVDEDVADITVTITGSNDTEISFS
jgi:hypothetical protein